MPDEIKDYSFLLREVDFPPEMRCIHVVPEDDIINHKDDITCPCGPQLNYKDPQTHKEVWVHNLLSEVKN